MSLDLQQLCNACCDIAREAGEKILEIYHDSYEIESKHDNTPLTTADLAAHQHISTALTALTPDIPVLSEEDAEIPFSTRKQWQRYWLVDPLDGTREFIKRNGEFSVNIALIDSHRSILGVINAPTLNKTYFAFRGNGAYRQIDQQAAEPIHTRPANLQNLTIAGSRSHRSERLQNFLSRLNNPEVVRLGSSLKSCMVAEGNADLYPRLGLTSEWDTAAAHCIVDEAGGEITRTDGSPLLYNTKKSLLNPDFFVSGDRSISWPQYLESRKR